MYANGWGVEKNEAQAAAWFHKAAEQNRPAAEYNLAVIYANGHGIVPDEAKATFWWRKAAEQGDRMAQDILREKGLLTKIGQAKRHVGLRLFDEKIPQSAA